jgi:A/G-specific adenine glycosylase
MTVSRKTIQELQRDLLDWYGGAKRSLPWRNHPDPYRVLVSELMLQQTQVQTVIPYFEKFMQRFPTIAVLAEASEEEVLRYWSGLGYYRRARSLHRAAKEVMLCHGGKIPENREEILRLPGIGPYTAGAVLSIAYGLREPLVDGNVERVLARIFGIEADLSSSQGKKALWDLAESLVPESRPGDFNQALMELGATTCLPSQPRCPDCPLSRKCTARREGLTETLPLKTRKIRREKVSEAVLLVSWRGKWLLTDRNKEGLYGGMWQFPWEWQKERSVSTQPALESLFEKFGLGSHTGEKLHSLVHAVTFRSIATDFYRVVLEFETPQKGRAGAKHHPLLSATDGLSSSIRWVETRHLAAEALPSYQKRVIPFLAPR